MSTNNENDSGIDEDYAYIFGPLHNAAEQSGSESWRGSSPDLRQNDKSGEEVEPEKARAAAEKGGAHHYEKEQEVYQEKTEKDPKGKKWADDTSEDEPRRGRSYQGSRQRVLPGSVLRRNQRQYLTKESVKRYRSLLSEMEIDANYEQNIPEGKSSPVTTKLGLVQWTEREEDNFFAALARKGKNSVKEIAQEVRSKSQLEVQEYIGHLQNAVQETGEANQDDLVRSFDIPAAVEISKETDEVLDRLAEHVSILDQRTVSTEGRQKHGNDTWLIDSKMAAKIDNYGKLDDAEALQPRIFSVAKLFHLTKWVRLSRNIFMNSGTSRLEDNWRNLAYKDETPSLTADAFIDYYVQAMSIIKQLVKLSILLAQDRLAMDLYVQHARVVRKKDVLRASRALNLKPNAFEQFIGVARRLQLDVAEISHKKGHHNHYLSCDEVEKVLSKKHRHRSARLGKISGSRGRTHGKSQRRFDRKDLTPRLSESGSAEEEDSDEEALSVLADEDQFMPAAKYDASDDDPHNNEDEYTEFIDQEASKDAELALRQLLQCPEMDKLPTIAKAKQDESPPVPEIRSRKRHSDDDVDWQDDLVYQAEWETFGRNWRRIDKAIAKNHKKRRLK